MVTTIMMYMYMLLVSVCVVAASAEDYKLTILHVNDVHARFEEADSYGGTCPDTAEPKCFGGVSRIAMEVEKIKKDKPTSVFVMPGDFFQGTVWYTINKCEPYNLFTPMMGLDAVTLGNHEFDDSLIGKPGKEDDSEWDGILPYLRALKNMTKPIPVLVSNMQEPTMLEEELILNSTILEIGGRRIGIIGDDTTETLSISSPGPTVEIFDEIESLTREAELLHKEGVDIILVLSHVGYEKDQEIAAKVPHIDVVIGGHSHTFLYTGTPKPGMDYPRGPYPTMAKGNDGRKVPIVQAYCNGKYLGELDVTFDKDGNVLEATGNPILLDKSHEQNATIEALVEEMAEEIDDQVGMVIGSTAVFLNSSCRSDECNLGDLFATSMVTGLIDFGNSTDGWTYVSLSFLNSGGIRSSIDETNSDGNITLKSIYTVAPFMNEIYISTMKGSTLKKIFEHAVYNYDGAGYRVGTGQFIQIAGIKVTYSLCRDSGSRVTSLEAKCADCRIPQYYDVQPDELYKVAIPWYVWNGGDGYTMIREEEIKSESSKMMDSDLLADYIGSHTPVTQGIEGRITVQAGDCSSQAHTTVSLALLISALTIITTT